MNVSEDFYVLTMLQTDLIGQISVILFSVREASHDQFSLELISLGEKTDLKSNHTIKQLWLEQSRKC